MRAAQLWWLREQVSRDAPPPLPGGYPVGERLFFTGASQTFPSGEKVVHGQQGEVTGPATGSHKGKGVCVLFPGNKDNVECPLTKVRRFRAASASSLCLSSAPHLSRLGWWLSAGEPQPAAAAAGWLQAW